MAITSWLLTMQQLCTLMLDCQSNLELQLPNGINQLTGLQALTVLAWRIT